jgi:hypothetical protein
MSNPQAKAERSKAKDARQSPAPDKPVSNYKKYKPEKPYIVFFKYKKGLFSDRWSVFGKYAKLEVAQEVIEREKLKEGTIFTPECDYKIEVKE